MKIHFAQAGSFAHLYFAVDDTQEDGRSSKTSMPRACLRAAIVEKAFPGAVFGVAHRGRVWALEGVGRFTYDPASPPVEAGTVYDLASLTKVVATTAMAMLLFQKNRLALDEPVMRLLPGFRAGEAVTLRLLLAHASGLPAHVPFFEQCRGREAVVRAALALPPAYMPGKEAQYSDPGFVVLGAALEALAGEPLDGFCKREIFGPLGMTRTKFGVTEAEQAAVPPTQEDRAQRHGTVQGEVHDENCRAMGGVAGHAGLFAPAGDLLRIAEATLAPLHGRPSPLFTSETVELFTRRAELPPGSSRALGWDTPSGAPSSAGALANPFSFGHLGYTGTSLWIDPTLDAAFVLLTNRTFPTRENKKIQEVRPRFHDVARKSLQKGTLPASPDLL